MAGQRIPTRGAVAEVLHPIFLYISSPEGSVMYEVYYLFWVFLGLSCGGLHKPFICHYGGVFIVIPLYKRLG